MRNVTYAYAFCGRQAWQLILENQFEFQMIQHLEKILNVQIKNQKRKLTIKVPSKIVFV